MSFTQTTTQEVDTLTASVRLRNGERTGEVSVDLRQQQTKRAGPSGNNDMLDSGRNSIEVSTFIKGEGQQEIRGGIGRLGINKVAVFVKTLNGHTQTIYITPNAFVKSLKDEISKKSSIHRNEYWLEHQGRQMEDGQRLSHYNVTDNSTLRMMGRLRGG